MVNENGMTDREAVVDAIIRFFMSLDDADEELLKSSITSDMIFDLTPFNATGFDYSLVTGQESVVNLLMSAVGKPLDTTHQTSNFRVHLDEDSASLTCYILAQHFRKGQGPPTGDDFQEHFLNANRYKADLVRDGSLWKIKKLEIHPSWTLGTPNVLSG